MNPVTITDIEAQVEAIVATTGQDPDAVRAVLTAMQDDSGEPVGVVRLNTTTGEVAHRVSDRGITKWRISHPADGMTYLMASTLTAAWTLLHQPDPDDDPAVEPQEGE